MAAAFSDAKNQGLGYATLTRSLPLQVGRELIAAYNDNRPGTPDLRGVQITPLYKRIYPNGPLGAHWMGFVAENEVANRPIGYYGVEAKYDLQLAGLSQFEERPLAPSAARLQPPLPDGHDIYLTIDRDVQAVVEQALADALASSGAQTGAILVMNPKTGEILAAAANPGYDPNRAREASPAAFTDPIISSQYEPGSVFKVLTMAAALDAGIVTPDTPFLDTGAVEVGGVIIRNWNGGAWGPQTMTTCMQHSLNVCLATVAIWLGPNNFYNYLQAFNIGKPTSVDLASEASGYLKRPGDSDWYDSDLATNSFGQGVAVTPLQLLAAISAVANDGIMMQPHIVRAEAQGGETRWTEPLPWGRPIRAETAHTLTDMLTVSLEKEASSALVPGYRVAGKTGTAQIPGPGGYLPDATIASFVGWLPADDPRLIILIKLDRPASSEWGSVVAAPVFSQLAQRLVVMLQIPPDAVRVAQAGR